MHPRLYVILAIAHGILFTLNIILAVNLAPILDSNMDETSGGAGFIGVMGCFGIIISCALTIMNWDEGSSSLKDKAVLSAVHAVIVVGLLYTWYYYGMVLISGSN